MSGRFTGELWARDFGVAVAIHFRPQDRFRWQLFALIGKVSLTVGFVRNRWYR
jgi:hypothetical protein